MLANSGWVAEKARHHIQQSECCDHHVQQEDEDLGAVVHALTRFWKGGVLNEHWEQRRPKCTRAFMTYHALAMA